jgi:hypothetical protein
MEDEEDEQGGDAGGAQDSNAYGAKEGGGAPPWGGDRLSPKGAKDGKGLLRCFQSLLRTAGLEDALRDPYSLEPKVRKSRPMASGADGSTAGGGGEDEGGYAWSAFVYAVSDQLNEMDAPYHRTLCKMLNLAMETEDASAWGGGGEGAGRGEDPEADEERRERKQDLEAMQRTIDKVWDLRPEVWLSGCRVIRFWGVWAWRCGLRG